jgi:hypothetical protein
MDIGALIRRHGSCRRHDVGPQVVPGQAFLDARGA